MQQLAVTVVGRDRPGIIAEVTRRLAELGLNLEDSTMTLLRGHFAFMLVCSGERSPAVVSESLAAVAADGTLAVDVRAVPEDSAAQVRERGWVLSVHGADRPGIVSAVTAELAAAGGNVTDLSTRLTGSLYVLLAEVELPPGVDADEVSARLRRLGQGLGIEVALRAAEADVL